MAKKFKPQQEYMAKDKKKESAPKSEKKDGTNLTAAEWIKRIKKARKFRDQIKDKQGWDNNEDAYAGEYKINNSLIKAPPINIVSGYVDTKVARMYARDPYFTVNAQKGTTIERAHLLEKAVNYLKKELGLKKEIERALVDESLVGYGWLKFGYTGDIETGPSTQGNNSTDAPVEEVSEFIRNGDIYVCYAPWEDVVFDHVLVKDPPYDCRWIAHRIVKPLATWKESKLYDFPADVQPNLSTVDVDGKKIEDTLKDSDDDMFEAWEIHDKDTNKIYVVGEGVDKFLREDENQLEMKGLPFSMLRLNPIAKKIRPFPRADITIILPQILERIKLRGAQLQHIKRWSRQLSIEKGAMSQEEMDKFTQGQDGAITQREKGSLPPTPIQYAPMQEEIFILDELIQKDMDTEIGQNEVDRGGETRKSGRQTKYELQQQQVGTATRTQKRQDKLEDFLGEVMSKVVALMKQFYTTDRYVAISGLSAFEVTEKFGLGPENVMGQGVMFDKDDIQGEYDIEVKAGSTLPLNKENKIKAVETMLEMLTKIGFAPGNPLQEALLSELLRDLDMQEAIKAFDSMKQKSQGPQGGPPPPAPQPQAPPPQGMPANMPPMPMRRP